MDPHKAMVVGDVVTGLCGAYRVEARHGEGAFGVTYRATEVATRASVILKELRIERLDDWKALELFEREGRVLASLSHPNIPAFRDSFVHGGAIPLPVSALSSDDAPERPSLILVQELIDGATLQHRIDRGERLSPTEAEGVLRALLGALDYLHGRNPPLVHRDIKPSNVVMSSTGRPSLVDFGTAPLLGQRLQSAAEALSQLAATPNHARAIRSHALAAIVGAAVASAAVVGFFTAGKPNGARPSKPPEPARSETAPLPQQVLPIPVGNIGGDRPAYRSLRSLASVAPDSVEGQLRAKGKHWTRSGGELNPGDYVEDILVGRLNQPAGRGDIAKVLSVSRGKGSGGERPAAFVDFGRGHSVGIFTTELSRIRFVD